MCVLAAYLGDRPAAEILLGMIERMEGLTCGHYSGLATVSEGKIHAARCVGSVATLRRETDAERLPGTCGIAHVRPALGGGREWAHPFVSGDRRFALAVNGQGGFFDRPGRLEERTCLLEGEGYVFRSRAKDPMPDVRPTPVAEVHASEMLLHWVDRTVRRDPDGEPWAAWHRALTETPSEIAALFLDAQAGERVGFARFNQPLYLAAGPGEWFLATSPLDFERDRVRWIQPLPSQASGRLDRSGASFRPLFPEPGDVATVLPRSAAEAIVAARLTDGSQPTVQDLKDATAHLWPEETAPQKDFLVYDILRELHAADRLRHIDRTVAGSVPGETATETHFERV